MKLADLIFCIIVLIFISYRITSNRSSSVKVSADTQSEQMEKSIQAFMDRPIHKHLTVDILRATKDDDLVMTVIDNLSTKISSDYSDQYEAISKLSKERLAIYTVFQVEGEVNNGGFNQFYFNSSGKFAEDAESAFGQIGAPKFQKLMGRANKVYRDNYEKITASMDGTIEGFSKSYEDNPLERLDKEFYDLECEENLADLEIKFIRDNLERFVDE